MIGGKIALAALLSVAIAGCAGMSRAMTYGSELADAKVAVGSRHFAVWVHDVDRTVLVNRTSGGAIAQGASQGATFGAVRGDLPAPIFRAAADAVLATMGCKAVDVYELGQGVSWEATYTCPEGIDPRKEVTARRPTWRAGISVPNPLASGTRT